MDVAEEISVGLVHVFIIMVVVVVVVGNGCCVGLLVYIVLGVLRLVGGAMSIVAIVVVVDVVVVVVVPIKLHVMYCTGLGELCGWRGMIGLKWKSNWKWSRWMLCW